MTRDLRQTVAELLAELGGPAEEDALCTLMQMPAALPLVAEAYRHNTNARRRAALINCLWQFRNPAAFPTLSAALRESNDHVWKEAVDGMVALGGDTALRLLEEALAALPDDDKSSVKREWIDEAIEQIRDNRDRA